MMKALHASAWQEGGFGDLIRCAVGPEVGDAKGRDDVELLDWAGSGWRRGL